MSGADDIVGGSFEPTWGEAYGEVHGNSAASGFERGWISLGASLKIGLSSCVAGCIEV